MQIMDHCIPQLTRKSKKNLPWLTKSVIQAIRKGMLCSEQLRIVNALHHTRNTEQLEIKLLSFFI